MGAAEPVSAPAGDVEGNARLTSANGMLLLVLLAAEGATILAIRQLITVHIFLGVLLIGPVLLKSASTVYRFVRYYTGAAAYRAKGPPHVVLRVLGPLVILSSFALLGTGVALLATSPDGAGALLTAHQASFFVWFAVVAVHVLGHLREAAVETWQDLRPGGEHRRRLVRFALVTAALVAGVATAAALLPSATPWTSGRDQHRHGPVTATRDDR